MISKYVLETHLNMPESNQKFWVWAKDESGKIDFTDIICEGVGREKGKLIVDTLNATIKQDHVFVPMPDFANANNASWTMLEELGKLQKVSAIHWNYMKVCLVEAIKKYIEENKI